MCIFWAHVVGQERSGTDMLSLYGAESPDGRIGPRWAHFLTCFVSLVEFGCSCWFCVMLSVRLQVLSRFGRSGDVRSRRSITFRSRGTGWRRAEVGTVSDLFRLLGRIWVFLLVLCHAKCPCACFEPLWSVRGCQGPTCYHFLEPSHKKGLLMPYW